MGADDFDAQCVQTFANIETALKSAGAGWGNVVQFYTLLVHSQDIAKFMKYRLREFPKLFPNGVYPPNTLLIIDRLVKEEFLIEIQADRRALAHGWRYSTKTPAFARRHISSARRIDKCRARTCRRAW